MNGIPGGIWLFCPFAISSLADSPPGRFIPGLFAPSAWLIHPLAHSTHGTGRFAPRWPIRPLLICPCTLDDCGNTIVYYNNYRLAQEQQTLQYVAHRRILC